MTDSLLPVGSRLGKYEILDHIASGGMAEVYRAFDFGDNRVVALKILPEHFADNPVLLERFRREARHASRLTHKNIVATYEWGEHENVHFLAMEFVEGTDLHNYISEKGHLDPQEAWVITVQAVRALDHACRQGITHRDIKPSNLLLSFQPGHKVTVKLADMGLAREMQAGDFRVTKDGTTVGTIDYMAPEQARDSALADARSDIYSLGCTLYHMLAGAPPFPDGGLGERIYKHLQSEVADVRVFNRRVPVTLWNILKKMLEKDPADRYQSPDELLQALLHLHEGDAPVQPSPRKGRRRTQSETPTPWHNPTPTSVAARQPVPETVDPRVAARGQFERATVVMSTDNQELPYALQLLTSCCRLDPGNVSYRKTLRAVARTVQREKGWTRWLQPVNVLAAKAKLKVAQAAADNAKVLEVGEEVLALAPDDVATQLTMADAARSLGMDDLGIWILEEMCDQDPDNDVLLRILARAYEKNQQVGKAVKAWNGVLKLVPYDLEAGRKLDRLGVEGTLRRGLSGR